MSAQKRTPRAAAVRRAPGDTVSLYPIAFTPVTNSTLNTYKSRLKFGEERALRIAFVTNPTRHSV